MLEEAEEREREFDAQKKQWNSGSFSYEKIQQYISDLEEERQNVGQLQEKCNGLEQKLKELDSDNSSLQKKLCEMQTRHKSDSNEREVGEMSFVLLFVRAIFVWPWSENAQTKQKQQRNGNKAIWLVYRTYTNAPGFWLVKRTLGWKNFMPEELSRNCFDVILQHDWSIEQCLLHIRVFFGGKTKSPCFVLLIHWLIKQITNTCWNHFSRSYENRSIKKAS